MILTFYTRLSRKKIKIIWFDLKLVLTTTQFEFIPYVDLYFKKQIYKNTKKYYEEIYGGNL